LETDKTENILGHRRPMGTSLKTRIRNALFGAFNSFGRFRGSFPPKFSKVSAGRIIRSLLLAKRAFEFDLASVIPFVYYSLSIVFVNVSAIHGPREREHQ